MPVIGSPRTFHKNFRFRVEIDGFGSANFSKVDGLSVEAAEVVHSEGGTIVPDKSPGRLTFGDVTLERGATSDLDLFEWFKDVADAAADAGLNEPDFRRMADIVQMDRNGDDIRRWRLFDCWPKTFTPGTWDNNGDENLIESVVLSVRFWDLVA